MLTEIKLENFKCFQEETIPLKPLTLLTGLNGMGKSSVIQAILFIKQSFDNRSVFSLEPWTLNGDYVELGTVRDILYQYFTKKEISIEISQNSNIGDTTAKWVFDASDADSDAVKLISERNPAEYAPDQMVVYPFHYLNAERIGPRVYFQMSNYKIYQQDQLGIRGEFAAHYLITKGDEQIRVPSLRFPEDDLDNPKYSLSLKDQVNAWLNVIKPGTRIVPSDYKEMSLVNLKYQFIAGTDKGNAFRPTNVGFGLSYVFPLIVAILISPPKSLLLLENPEAHLHPRGQSEIGRLIALAVRANIQVILETHSDHIMNGIRVAVKEGILEPDKCSFLYFTGDLVDGRYKHYIERIKLSKSGKLSHRPDGFFDEWDNLLTKLI